jgi:hypothetical protein
MLLRYSVVFFLSCLLPAQASLPPKPHQQQALSMKAVFRLARSEMPLPVVRVLSWRLSEGKKRYVIEMSTASLPRAKNPILHVMFEIRENGNGLVQALHQASALVKAFIEEARNGLDLRPVVWQRLDPQQATGGIVPVQQPAGLNFGAK